MSSELTCTFVSLISMVYDVTTGSILHEENLVRYRLVKNGTYEKPATQTE